MNTKYFIGLDLGTTNIKGALYSNKGKRISSCKEENKSTLVSGTRNEQDPEGWLASIQNILGKLLLEKKLKDNLEAICLSTQGGTFVMVDNNGNPLCNAITWLDRRGYELFEKIKHFKEKNSMFYEKTGYNLDANLAFLNVYWLKEYQKELFKKTAKILFANDYILSKICTDVVQDPSNASISMFYNVSSDKWDPEILSLLGVDQTYFSPIKDSGVPVGYLNDKICKGLDINHKVKVINGGHDQYCASIGAGIFDEKELLLSTGTAWVIFKTLNKQIMDREHLFGIGRHILKNKFGLIYSIPTAGASLDWFGRKVMKCKDIGDFYNLINSNSTSLSNLKNNIIFYPYLTGEIPPYSGQNSKASFLNIGIDNNYLDIIKAIMEGIGFQLKKVLDVLRKEGTEVNKIRMVGGGTRNGVWPRIISDITGLEVLMPEDNNEDFATKGAAILAGYGAKIFSSIEQSHRVLKTDFKTVNPDMNKKPYYAEKYNKYLKN